MDATLLATSPQGHFRAYGKSLAANTLQIQIETVDGALIDWVTWQEAIALLQSNGEFRTLLTTALAGCPYAAFFWETPPITVATLTQPWECVVVDAPSLAQVQANPQAFGRYIAPGQGTNTVTTFPNLKGDAQLVVPCCNGSLETYGHIGTFLRQGPKPQINALWQRVGQGIQTVLAERRAEPLWVSTSGLGVYWLHIRLDNRPKYYTHTPYRQVV
ncbi:MAG: hypothetical protein ACFB0C_22485 [Leptolyngbyaceae cyanobacterium]